MCLINFILKKVLPLPKLTKCESFLFIGPHPDDIEIATGATVAKLAAMGKRIKFLICTDGRYGIDKDDITIESAIAIRQEEARRSAEFLGVSDIEFLPFPDGGDYKIEDLTKEILRVITTFQPDIVFAPDPKLITELHLDHINVGLATGYAFLASGISKQMKDNNLQPTKTKGIAYYYTDKPNTYFKVKKVDSKKQRQAIKLHVSQMPEGSLELKAILAYILIRQFRYGMRRCKGRVDCYRLLGSMHIHCVAEFAKF